jgi:hypothetical protein
MAITGWGFRSGTIDIIDVVRGEGGGDGGETDDLTKRSGGCDKNKTTATGREFHADQFQDSGCAAS